MHNSVWTWVITTVVAIGLGMAEGCLAKRFYRFDAEKVFWFPLIWVGSVILLLRRYNISFDFFWGVAFVAIAQFFAVKDLLCREVSDWLHGLIFLLGCFRLSGGTWKSMLLGLVICSVPMLLVVLIRGGGIGGADIKCVAAIGWALGWRKSIGTLAVGCVLILFGTLFSALRRRKKSASAPMVPYLCASAMLMYTIF